MGLFDSLKNLFVQPAETVKDKVDLIEPTIRPELDKVEKVFVEEIQEEPETNYDYPSYDDEKWTNLVNQRNQHFVDHKFGLYRNDTLSMGQRAEKLNDLKSALCLYFEVCYIDLNGARNSSKNLAGLYPDFEPQEHAFVAPGVVTMIENLKSELKLKKTDLKQLFIEHNRYVQRSLKTPLSPEKAWTQFNKEHLTQRRA